MHVFLQKTINRVQMEIQYFKNWSELVFEKLIIWLKALHSQYWKKLSTC